jgi:hypothetical protein
MMVGLIRNEIRFEFREMLPIFILITLHSITFHLTRRRLDRKTAPKSSSVVCKL